MQEICSDADLTDLIPVLDSNGKESRMKSKNSLDERKKKQQQAKNSSDDETDGVCQYRRIHHGVNVKQKGFCIKIDSIYSFIFQKNSGDESENKKKSKKSLANGKPRRKKDVIVSSDDDGDKVRHFCLCNVENI